MTNCRNFLIIILFSFCITFTAVSQETGSVNVDQNKPADFFLIPVLETVFSKNVKWRPDWRPDIPPDGFIVSKSGGTYEVIELSGENDSFIVRRDREGRLLEFPFFYADSYAAVEVSYNVNGSLSGMDITLKNYSSSDENNQPEEKTINIDFPDNFLPYSQMSPGGSFPPVNVTLDDASYYVFIFESPVFLSETWFADDGNVFQFCSASVNVENGGWRIKSLEIQNAAGALFTDYFFDSYGNITEIKIIGGIFLALYNENLPNYWRNNDSKFELFWDTKSILRIIRASEFIDDIYTEYRYEYEFDSFGNWVSRQETAYIISSNLLVPNPSYGRGKWTRRIVY